MHELSLMNHLLRLVDREAIAAGGGRVTRIRVVLGEFSGVEPELLESAFRIAARSSRCRDASLEIQVEPLEAECRDCGALSRVVAFHFVCARCGSNQIEIRSGEEIKLESITLSVDEEDDPNLEREKIGDLNGVNDQINTLNHDNNENSTLNYVNNEIDTFKERNAENELSTRISDDDDRLDREFERDRARRLGLTRKASM
jgi:hydrogenase nickel incorporation protein HypA/HybF